MPLLVHGQYVKSGRESTRTPASVLVSILGILPIKYLILWHWPGCFSSSRYLLRPRFRRLLGDDKAQWRWVRYDEKMLLELRRVSWAITNNEADVDAIDRIRKQVTSARQAAGFATDTEGTSVLDHVAVATRPMCAGMFPKSVIVKPLGSTESLCDVSRDPIQRPMD